jgi:hypothetical protein
LWRSEGSRFALTKRPLQKAPIQLNNIDLEGAEIPVHIFTEHNVAGYMSSSSIRGAADQAPMLRAQTNRAFPGPAARLLTRSQLMQACGW